MTLLRKRNNLDEIYCMIVETEIERLDIEADSQSCPDEVPPRLEQLKVESPQKKRKLKES